LLRHQPQKFENVILVARWRKHFWGLLAIFLVVDLPPKKKVVEHTKFFSRLVNWCCHSVESRALMCRFKQDSLSAWSLLSWHIHTSEWDSLFFQSCLLFNVTVLPSDSDYINSSASTHRFRLIRPFPSRRSRVRFFAFVPRGTCVPSSRCTKSLETVVTRVVTGISHCIVLFCEMYWLAGVWCLCYVWLHTLFLLKCSGTELVLCDFKLYFTRFVQTKGLLSETFVIVFLQIVSLWSLSIWTRIIFNNNELVNQTRHWNEMAHERNSFMNNNAPQAKNICKKNALQVKLTSEISVGTRFFWPNLDEYSVLLM
jgi:hypothetical protein